MKLSIIALYYNQESYIDKMLLSIKYAQLDDYEVIIIDDGSDTPLSFDKVSKIIPNIKIINLEKNTKNQSYCRNLGIKCAIGDYITYIDSDDYYCSEELNKVYNFISNNDVYLTTIVSQERHNKNLYAIRNIYKNTQYPSICICQYITKRKYIIDNNLYWDEIKYNWDAEDLYYGMLVLSKTNDIKYCPYNFYIHKRINNSNSDRKGNIYYNYMIYLTDMYQDVVKISNKKYFHVFEKIIYNEIKGVKILNG